MRVVYLAHPVSGDVIRNLDRAREWIRVFETECPDVAIVASWITECEIWDDADAAQRAKGLERDCAVLSRCDELWYCGVPYGEPSAGMAREIGHAQSLGKPVRWLGQELPDG